jgi:hypothetical protein
VVRGFLLPESQRFEPGKRLRDERDVPLVLPFARGKESQATDVNFCTGHSSFGATVQAKGDLISYKADRYIDEHLIHLALTASSCASNMTMNS